MSNVVFWRQVFLGASLFLCGGYPIIAAEVGDLTPNVGTRSLQQDGRRVICAISDKAGPIVGANVLVKGTTIGNISDMDGRVILEGVPSNAILVVSYIGYVSQEIPLKSSQTNVRIQLVEDTQALDEVVVVGYGTQSKKDITGSVAVVSTDAIHETPVATFAEALQGKASGVYISNSGGPSGETTIRIRGVGSLNSSDPLIVVDGVSGVDISSVNPNDIESMQVLKDASATAIYGAQGANGVIIITTKQGTRADRVRVSYNGYFGVAKMANSGYDLLNGWESMEFEELGQQNLYNYRGLATSHPQFGQIAATGGKGISMPYAIKPAGYSEQQIIDMYGSVEAWEKSYVDDGSSSWARSAYYQMLADGYSVRVPIGTMRLYRPERSKITRSLWWVVARKLLILSLWVIQIERVRSRILISNVTLYVRIRPIILISISRWAKIRTLPLWKREESLVVKEMRTRSLRLIP